MCQYGSHAIAHYSNASEIIIIEASLSEPHTNGSSTQFGVVNHAQTTTDKTGKLTIGFPCRGEIHSVDYYTSLFALCHRPCHGELHGKLENFSIEMNREERLQRRRELYRLRRDRLRDIHIFIFISYRYGTLVWTTEVTGYYTRNLREITRFIQADLIFNWRNDNDTAFFNASQPVYAFSGSPLNAVSICLVHTTFTRT